MARSEQWSGIGKCLRLNHLWADDGRVRSRYRVPTPVMMGGIVAALIGLVTALTLVKPAVSTPPDRCTRFVQQSHAHAQDPDDPGGSTAVIGDSYAAGSGLDDPASGWTSRLPGRVFVYAFPGSGFSRDAGKCGGESFAERAPEALQFDPHLVVVQGGLNDIDQTDREIRAGLRRLLTQIGTRRVLIVGPAPAPTRYAGALRVDRVLRAAARRTGTPYLSMIERRLDYLPDGVHLTSTGHRKFGAIVANRIDASR